MVWKLDVSYPLVSCCDVLKDFKRAGSIRVPPEFKHIESIVFHHEDAWWPFLLLRRSVSGYLEERRGSTNISVNDQAVVFLYLSNENSL